MTNGKKRVVIRVGRVILRRRQWGHIYHPFAEAVVNYTSLYSLEVVLVLGALISMAYLLVTPQHLTIMFAEFKVVLELQLDSLTFNVQFV